MERPSSREALDERWHARLMSLSVSAFEMLDGTAEVRLEEKRKFLSGEIESPQLDYPQLEHFDFTGTEESLLALKAEVLSEEKNDVVREIYRVKINEVIAEVRMLAAARLGNDKAFNRYSEFVYGKPDALNTAEAAKYLHDTVVKKGETAQKGNDSLMEILETFSQVQPTVEIHEPGVTLKGRVSGIGEVVEAFETALATINADGWKVVVTSDASITNFRVSQDRKEITVPEVSASNMLKKRLAAFIEHEVMTHVLRRVNGDETCLLLLGQGGLDRVEKGEEGPAMLREQKISGAEAPAHPLRYFAIAFASGLVDGQKKNFKETFQVLKEYYLATLKPGEDIEERAANSAWTLAVRVFRGTTGKTPGAVFTKDMAYFLGNKETWALVNADEEVVYYFNVGKFDAANERHIGYTISLGVTDEKLLDIHNKAFS